MLLCWQRLRDVVVLAAVAVVKRWASVRVGCCTVVAFALFVSPKRPNAGGLGLGLQKAGKLKPLLDRAKPMSLAFASALRLSFHDMFVTFRGGTRATTPSITTIFP
jgi:hypothetical protein